ncbi:MAG: NlpC/P60 family protein [Actinomycetes bacterium]
MLQGTARRWRVSSPTSGPRTLGFRPSRSVVGAALALVVLFAGFVVAPDSSAAPTPSRDINQVASQVRDLEMQAESATERYNNARNELADVQAQLDALKQRSKRESRHLQQVLASVDDLARSAYTSGGMDTSLQVLLAENPSEFLAQAAALDQVAQSQSAAIRRTQTARVRLAQSQAAIKDKEALAQSKRTDMASAKADADKRLADAQALLASLKAAERQRLAQLAAQQRRSSFSAARSAALQLPSGSSASAAGGGFAGGGRGALAVRYALSHVGQSYVAAAAGPSAFDCSGLTLAAWRQAGVSLPHYSFSQYSTTRHIPLSMAQPGDLLFFFGGGTHHVAMYIGGGKMVHAANPSSGVIVSSVNEGWYQQRFSGVGRVVG